jgi:hypothetical protein
MGIIEELLKADATRREAMINADVDILSKLLGENLIWTHSSGKTEDKRAVLAAINSRTVEYQVLTIDEHIVTQYDNLFIYSGILDGRASRDGVGKDLKSKFLSVWEFDDTGFKMLAWQSTGFK